jgi:hypothetical protein
MVEHVTCMVREGMGGEGMGGEGMGGEGMGWEGRGWEGRGGEERGGEGRGRDTSFILLHHRRFRRNPRLNGNGGPVPNDGTIISVPLRRELQFKPRPNNFNFVS